MESTTFTKFEIAVTNKNFFFYAYTLLSPLLFPHERLASVAHRSVYGMAR